LALGWRPASSHRCTGKIVNERISLLKKNNIFASSYDTSCCCCTHIIPLSLSRIMSITSRANAGPSQDSFFHVTWEMLIGGPSDEISDGEREERNISLLMLLCLWMRVHYRDLTFPLHSFQTERLSHFVCATTLHSQQQLFFLSGWMLLEREYRKEVRGGSERRPPTAAHSRWYTTTAGEMSYAYTLSALVYKLENVTKFYTEPHSVTHLHSRSLFLLQKKN
jgi:hypothetical protein